MPEIGCLWTYFGHTSDDLWSASEYLLMFSDARRCALMTSGDSGVPPINSICTPDMLRLPVNSAGGQVHPDTFLIVPGRKVFLRLLLNALWQERPD